MIDIILGKLNISIQKSEKTSDRLKMLISFFKRSKSVFQRDHSCSHKSSRIISICSSSSTKELDRHQRTYLISPKKRSRNVHNHDFHSFKKIVNGAYNHAGILSPQKKNQTIEYWPTLNSIHSLHFSSYNVMCTMQVDIFPDYIQCYTQGTTTSYD